MQDSTSPHHLTQIDAAHRARVPHEALTLTYNKMRAEPDLQIRAARAWRV